MDIKPIYQIFPSQDAWIAYLEEVCWKGTPVCPYCKSTKVSPLPKEKRHHCNTCNTSFSVTVQTMFHNTKIDLRKWFIAVSLVLKSKYGINARQLSRDINVNKDTAWYMVMRIRKAKAEQGDLLEGIIGIDETYAGRKPREGKVNNPNKKGTASERGQSAKKAPRWGWLNSGQIR